jgi:hypothetical protein
MSQIFFLRIYVLKFRFCGRTSETTSLFVTHNIFVDELQWSASAITKKRQKAFATLRQTSQGAETVSFFAERHGLRNSRQPRSPIYEVEFFRQGKLFRQSAYRQKSLWVCFRFRSRCSTTGIESALLSKSEPCSA